MTDSTTTNIFIQPTQEYLQKRMGHHWNPVSVDPTEYGMLGEPMTIMPVFEGHKPTHYQSSPLSAAVASVVADRLAAYGFTNPAHFTKVDTGLGYTVLLLTKDGVLKALDAPQFKEATRHLPIIGDTGIASKAKG